MKNISNSQLRILDLYLLLKKGIRHTTKELACIYNTTPRTINRDIEKINEIISPSKVLFDRSTHIVYLEDENSTLLLDSEEQLILNILDKACVEQGDDFHKKALNLFDKFKDSLHNTIYNNIDSEDISAIKIDLAKVENAIYKKYKISLTYNNKNRIVNPLKLANFEGYWYLVVHDNQDNRIKTFYFKDIKNLVILSDVYNSNDYKAEKDLKNAINAYFTTDVTPYEIELFVTKEKAHIFKRKPISNTQRILKEYSDGSFEFSIMITHDMEIIPKIQQFMPHLKVINKDKHSKRIINIILEHISDFSNNY